MAERLTVTKFPKDIQAIAEYLVKCTNTKSVADAAHTCGLLYLLGNPQKDNRYKMDISRVLELKAWELPDVINNPNYELLLIKYKNDDDTEEDGEVSEP